MKFRDYIKLSEDIVDSALGDDNLEVILRKDTEEGQLYWEVKIYKDRELIEKYKFYDEREARNKFKEIEKEF